MEIYRMKNIMILLIWVFIGGSVFAQEKLTDERRMEFEAQKVAFFTSELDLTPQEAAVFWPLYNQMRKKMEFVEMGMRKGYWEIQKAKGVKEEQYKEAVQKMLRNEKEVQEIKEAYYQNMMKVVPASKIWKLNEAERKFHRQLFNKLKRESCPQNNNKKSE